MQSAKFDLFFPPPLFPAPFFAPKVWLLFPTSPFFRPLGTSLEVGLNIFRELGHRRSQAVCAAMLFKRHDEQSVRHLAQFWEDDDAYFKNARQHIEAFKFSPATRHGRKHDSASRAEWGERLGVDFFSANDQTYVFI